MEVHPFCVPPFTPRPGREGRSVLCAARFCFHRFSPPPRRLVLVLLRPRPSLFAHEHRRRGLDAHRLWARGAKHEEGRGASSRCAPPTRAAAQGAGDETKGRAREEMTRAPTHARGGPWGPLMPWLSSGDTRTTRGATGEMRH